MYFCTDCKKKFFDPKIIFERHGFVSPPFEKIFTCPYCGSDEITYIEVRYCKCCGARLSPHNHGDYCNRSCKKRGEKMWEREEKSKLLRLYDPIGIVMRKLEEYNKANNTKLSYGQFVALVLPKERKHGHRTKKGLS